LNMATTTRAALTTLGPGQRARRAPTPRRAVSVARAPADGAEGADPHPPSRPRRRDALVALAASFGASALTLADAGTRARALAAPPPSSPDPDALTRLRVDAARYYDAADFPRAFDALDALCALDPGNPDWIEGRAQVAVDAKRFDRAVADYTALIDAVDVARDPGAAARFRAGRALAYEGLYAWPLALVDYDETLRLAAAGGFLPDPYVLNARGNVRASTDDWAGAREDYAESARLFQSSKGFRSGASTTQRLDGAVYAASNAALALAQLGDDAGAITEAEAVARRAPNSADMRAALAALYYSRGRVAEAEEAWERACGRNVGCGKYRDLDYVRRIRRWPPVMVDKLDAFLSIR
jgi:tetratricopeptide (TPR) repeat protein